MLNHDETWRLTPGDDVTLWHFADSIYQGYVTSLADGRWCWWITRDWWRREDFDRTVAEGAEETVTQAKSVVEKWLKVRQAARDAGHPQKDPLPAITPLSDPLDPSDTTVAGKDQRRFAQSALERMRTDREHDKDCALLRQQMRETIVELDGLIQDPEERLKSGE